MLLALIILQAVRVGDEVSVIDSTERGVVVAISGHQALVRVDGFDIPFSLDQLVKRAYQIDLTVLPKKDALSGIPKVKVPSSKEAPQIDLHIEELLDDHRGMSNTEILLHQMSRMKSFISKSRNNGEPRVIIIHGVGEGVLKSEVHTWLANQPGIEFYDASWRHYGRGATEVVLRRT